MVKNFNKFETKKSKIEGNGVFAIKDIKKGEIICKFRGKKVSIDKLKKEYAIGKERIDDPFQISSKEYILLKKPYINFNHSCSPNAGIKNKGILFAINDIKKGQEITYDYSTTEDTNDKAWGINWTDIWRIKCNCMSKNCRREIRVFEVLPEKLKKKYFALDALPDFILRKMKK